MSPDHQPPKKVVVVGSSSCDLSYLIPETMLQDSRVKLIKKAYDKFTRAVKHVEKDIGTELYNTILDSHTQSVTEAIKTKLLLDDIKATADEHEALPGGGGYNVAKNLQILSAQLGLDTEITLITKLGPDRVYDYRLDKHTLNIGAQKVRSATDDQNGFLNLIDIAEDDHAYRTPVNAILLSPDGRSILKAPETGVLQAQFHEHAPSYASKVYSEITHAISAADLVIIQASKFPFITAHAARVAKQHGVPVLVDYDVSSTTHLLQAAEILRNATFVVAPDDAIAPDRWPDDQGSIHDKLVQNNHHYNPCLTAISNGIKPILVNTDYSDFQIDVPLKELSVRDKNGAGDLRDAAMAFALLAGNKPLEALRFGSAVSSFGTHYSGREWANHLGEFLEMYQKYKIETGLSSEYVQSRLNMD